MFFKLHKHINYTLPERKCNNTKDLVYILIKENFANISCLRLEKDAKFASTITLYDQQVVSWKIDKSLNQIGLKYEKQK